MNVINILVSMMVVLSGHWFTSNTLTSKEAFAVFLAAWCILTLSDIADEIRAGLKRLSKESQ